MNEKERRVSSQSESYEVKGQPQGGKRKCNLNRERALLLGEKKRKMGSGKGDIAGGGSLM